MSYSGSDIQIQIYLTLTECQAPQVAKHYIHCGHSSSDQIQSRKFDEGIEISDSTCVDSAIAKPNMINKTD